jgi:hypothetical protein
MNSQTSRCTPQSIVYRFFKTVGHKLNAIQTQRKEDSQYRMYIDSYQAKLKQALNSLFHAMKAEIDWERDPREKEALRFGREGAEPLPHRPPLQRHDGAIGEGGLASLQT